ncbi:MAG: DUF2927 domain-containing protein [Gammaproteobacteria bacterium]
MFNLKPVIVGAPSIKIPNLLFFLIISCFPLAGTAESPHWHSSAYIANSFAEIALNSRNRYGTRKIIKWQKSINYYFDHRYPDKEINERLTNLHLSHLSKITGLSINQTKYRANANLVIVFSREKNIVRDFSQVTGVPRSSSLGSMIGRNICLAHTRFDSLGRINRATVLISVDKAREKAKLVSCIVEELSEILGLPNDSDKVYPSIFNDRSPEDLLTGLDYLMLKILYDKRIKAGMQRRELMPVLYKIIADLKNTEAIGTAEREVKKGGLYALMHYS